MTRERAIAYLHDGLLYTDTCWVWLGKRQKAAGYSIATIDGKFTYLHRFAYELARGPIPDDLVIDHLCRRPYCMNPAHMDAVTRGENSRRGVSARGARTHCPNGHPLSGDNVRLEPHATGFSRRCRACKNEAQRRRFARDSNRKAIEAAA